MAVDSGTVAIDPGKTFEKSYDIESAGVFLFEFKTQRHDVQFTALWLPAVSSAHTPRITLLLLWM